MIRLFIISLISFTSLSIQSQNWSDSIAQFENDSLRLVYLEKEATKFFYADIESAKPIVELYNSIAQKQTLEKYHGNALILSGNIHFVQSQHAEAIPYYIKAIEILEPLDAPLYLAKGYNNLASCYQVRNDTEKSADYFKKALDIYENLKDTLWIANVNSNLGLQYLNDGVLDKAEVHLDEAVKRFDQIENQIFKGISLLNRGNLRIEQEQYNQAIEDYRMSETLVPMSVSPLVHAACMAGKGTAYNRLGNYDKALPFLLSSLSKAEEIKETGQMRESSRELADLYKSLGNYKQALSYHESYTALKDSIFTIEQDAKLSDALTKYETDQKENEIELLNTQNELQSTRLSARNNQLLLMGIGSLFLLGLLGTLYNFYGRIKKQNSIISTSLEEKDTLLREIHHRVKNNLQVISALLTLQSKHVKDNQAVVALQEGQGRVQSMALIHQDLYQHDNLKGVNTKDYFEKLVDNLIDTYNTEDRNIQLECEIESLPLDVDTMIPLGLVVNELTSNALKHAFGNRMSGNIKISLQENDNLLLLKVEDDGQGAEPIQLENKSFGFSLIKSFARRLDAEIDIRNVDGLKVTMSIKNYHKAA